MISSRLDFVIINTSTNSLKKALYDNNIMITITINIIITQKITITKLKNNKRS